jgi:hypothetical protein
MQQLISEIAQLEQAWETDKHNFRPSGAMDKVRGMIADLKLALARLEKLNRG